MFENLNFIKNIIKKENTSKVMPPILERLRNYVPKELIPYFESINKDQYSSILSKLNVSALPFNFCLNVRGGWITPDGIWFLKSMTGNYDDTLKTRLKNSKEYNFNTRLQAFKEGWVRQDWIQSPFGSTFINTEKPLRTLRFTFDPIALKSQDMLWAVQNIARLYTVLMPKGIWYEIRTVKYNNDTILNTKTDYRGLEFFLIGLDNIKRKI